MTSAALTGSTGLVGSHILTQLLGHPNISAVSAFARRTPSNPTNSTKLTALTATDSSTWPSLFPTAPSPQIFFSALGTTKAQAGSFEAQRKIDYDLNLALAQKAKEVGTDTYVLISSAGATSSSMIAYTKMKGELEDAVKKLGFKHVVILKPGLIVGAREDSRPTEYLLRVVAGGLKKVSGALVDPWAQDAEAIARAAVRAGLDCVEGKREAEGVWEVGQGEIVRLGKKV
ncbi:NAD(P)-binding protein [Amniculicola lignicola CBS 123094]|uniref:NAD(P)-binding protein n=1 Tax=Amniculicola lignicola CBS 123094 TaxID=1392246 RepID=A0A6A5WCL7_9PLEO|nr:NAD(P)-binding protein [Amniculicola lignicola CBS 123094]